LARAVGIRPEVRTTRYLIPLSPGFSREQPLTIAYASDFHAGPATNPALLRGACAALQTAGADVLLLGGDFVTLVPSEIDWLAHELGQISAPLGRYAVLGNHDWCSDTSHIVRTLEAAGIRVLINRSVRLEEPFQHIWICGLDDHGYGNPDAAATWLVLTVCALSSCTRHQVCSTSAQSVSTLLSAVIPMEANWRFQEECRSSCHMVGCPAGIREVGSTSAMDERW